MRHQIIRKKRKIITITITITIRKARTLRISGEIFITLKSREG